MAWDTILYQCRYLLETIDWKTESWKIFSVETDNDDDNDDNDDDDVDDDDELRQN